MINGFTHRSVVAHRRPAAGRTCSIGVNRRGSRGRPPYQFSSRALARVTHGMSGKTRANRSYPIFGPTLPPSLARKFARFEPARRTLRARRLSRQMAPVRRIETRTEPWRESTRDDRANARRDSSTRDGSKTPELLHAHFVATVDRHTLPFPDTTDTRYRPRARCIANAHRRSHERGYESRSIDRSIDRGGAACPTLFLTTFESRVLSRSLFRRIYEARRTCFRLRLNATRRAAN